MQATECHIDVHASSNEMMYKGSDVARRVEREKIARVEYKTRLLVDLATNSE